MNIEHTHDAPKVPEAQAEIQDALNESSIQLGPLNDDEPVSPLEATYSARIRKFFEPTDSELV